MNTYTSITSKMPSRINSATLEFFFTIYFSDSQTDSIKVGLLDILSAGTVYLLRPAFILSITQFEWIPKPSVFKD